MFNDETDDLEEMEELEEFTEHPNETKVLMDKIVAGCNVIKVIGDEKKKKITATARKSITNFIKTVADATKIGNPSSKIRIKELILHSL